MVLLESGSDVLYYCENYPSVTRRIEGKNRTSIFDAFVLYRNGSVLLIEIKDDLSLIPKEGTREYWQLRTQEVYTSVYNLPYERRDRNYLNQFRMRIQNWKPILADLTTWFGRDLRKEEALVFHFVKSCETEGCTLRTIMNECRNNSKDTIRVATYRLLHMGEITAPLNHVSYQDAFFRIHHE